MQNLLDTLTPQQQTAVRLIQLSLDCFNSVDGTGLFTGMTRYPVLAGRVELCAVQARNIPEFWAALLRKMRWPVPPRQYDSRIAELFQADDQPQVLRCLATEAVSIVTIARMLHSAQKPKLTEQSIDTTDYDDSLEGIL